MASSASRLSSRSSTSRIFASVWKPSSLALADVDGCTVRFNHLSLGAYACRYAAAHERTSPRQVIPASFILISETRERNRRRLALVAGASSLVLVPFKGPIGRFPHHCLGWSHTRRSERSLAGSTGLGM